MNILIVGAGVIGTVYGAHLAAAGNTVYFLSHGPRTDDVAASGLSVRDKADGGQLNASVTVVQHADGTYDVVLVAVRRDQLATVCVALAQLGGSPAIVLFGNNPAGHSAMPGDVYLGFPGIGGELVDGTASYVRIRPQPTALQQTSDRRLDALESALSGRGFDIQRVEDMDGWLAYHTAFVACIAAALYRCGTYPMRLSADRITLTLMCRAITQSFAALRGSGTAGLPGNLRLLHNRFLTAVAVRYWARTMRSPQGELWFAAHARHAEAEMRTLGQDVQARTPGLEAVEELLGSRNPRAA